MTLSPSARIAAARRIIRRVEEDRPVFLKRFADRSEAERELAIKTYEDALQHAKRKLEGLLAEQAGH
jgi:hypothetical protein